MAARTRKRPVRKIGRKMKTKLFALFMLIVVAMLGLIGRLMFIEYTSGDAYTKKVLSLQSYDSKQYRFREEILWIQTAQCLLRVWLFIMLYLIARL